MSTSGIADLPSLTALDVLQALPTAAVILDRDAGFVTGNAAWTRFCIEHDDFVVALRPGDDFVQWCVDEAGPVGDGIRSVLEHGMSTFAFSYPSRDSNGERWYRIEASPLGSGALVTYSDFGDEYAHLTQWLAGGVEAIIELDAQLTQTYVSDPWSRMTGGAEWTAPFDAECLAEVHTALRDCLVLRDTFTVHVHGGGRIYRLAGSPQTGARLGNRISSVRVVVVITDITVERDAVVRAAADDERHRVAADVHDTVIQRLYGTALDLARRTGDGSADAGVLQDTISRIDRAIGDLRALGRPESTSLANLAERESPAARIDAVLIDAAVALGFEPTARLDGELETLDPTVVPDLLAVLNESLANVARHAGATSCEVHLAGRGDHLILTVIDDGRGMPVEQTRNSGTRNIAERAESLGGRAMWSAGVTNGTTMTWQVPLARTSSGRVGVTATAD